MQMSKVSQIIHAPASPSSSDSDSDSTAGRSILRIGARGAGAFKGGCLILYMNS